MFLYVAHSRDEKYLGMRLTSTEARAINGVYRVYKINLDEVIPSEESFLQFLKLIKIPRETIINAILKANLPPKGVLTSNEYENPLKWHSDKDYGDGEYVIHKGRRVWAIGRGNEPG